MSHTLAVGESARTLATCIGVEEGTEVATGEEHVMQGDRCAPVGPAEMSDTSSPPSHVSLVLSLRHSAWHLCTLANTHAWSIF